jgi:hypothetical protein
MASSSSPPPPLPDTDDPFVLLGLDPTTDRKEIKRAYKRRALRYHPDVVVGPGSTPEERREASEQFARVNAAYEALSGKGGKAGTGTGTGSGRAGASSSSSSSGGYRPPHRRSGAGGSSARGGVGWEDFMPNYDSEDAKYDAGDDSMSKIFSDLFAGAAAGAAGYAAGGGGGRGGGGGILKDLIDFLEGNVDGFASGGGGGDDAELGRVLSVGSLDEVAEEMDDTQLLATQLETKLDNMEAEMVMLREEARQAARYAERVGLEERVAEIEARKGVVGSYLKKSRKRLVKLQARYKELIVEGRTDRRAGRGGYGSGGGGGGGGGGGTSPPPPSASPPPPSYASSPSPSPSPSPPPRPAPGDGETESQSFDEREGFGSFGRRGGRGTSRRGRRGQGSGAAAPPPPSPSEARASSSPSARPAATPPPAPAPSPEGGARPSSLERKADWKPPVAPHRRTGADRRVAAESRKRLREIKVDDEFEKLKREMGL